MQYWAILLKNHRNKGKDGLTLPFLIGSQNYLKNQFQRQTISDIINDIVENAPFEVCLRYCLKIKTFILEIKKDNNKVYYPSCKGKHQTNLSIAEFSKNDLGTDIESVIHYLVEKFTLPIESKKYSASTTIDDVRSVVWEEFDNSEDIPFILKSFEIINNKY